MKLILPVSLVEIIVEKVVVFLLLLLLLPQL